jgi:hypothetical protein
MDFDTGLGSKLFMRYSGLFSTNHDEVTQAADLEWKGFMMVEKA